MALGRYLLFGHNDPYGVVLWHRHLQATVKFLRPERKTEKQHGNGLLLATKPAMSHNEHADPVRQAYRMYTFPVGIVGFSAGIVVRQKVCCTKGLGLGCVLSLSTVEGRFRVGSCGVVSVVIRLASIIPSPEY